MDTASTASHDSLNEIHGHLESVRQRLMKAMHGVESAEVILSLGLVDDAELSDAKDTLVQQHDRVLELEADYDEALDAQLRAPEHAGTHPAAAKAHPGGYES